MFLKYYVKQESIQIQFFLLILEVQWERRGLEMTEMKNPGFKGVALSTLSLIKVGIELEAHSEHVLLILVL